MLIAVEHLGEVGVGITTPHFFRADDDNTYVVKLQNNRLGPKVLVSEFLAARIGKIMRLCFPPSSLILIPKELLEKNQQLAITGVQPGLHFASQYLNNAEYLDKNNLSKATNIKEMAGIMLFDHMFHNLDRSGNKKNLLLCREEDAFKIYAIDNSHLFKAGRWTVKSLEKLANNKKIYYRRNFGLLLKDCLTPDDFLSYLENLKKLTDSEITNIINDIPAEWLTDETERQALAQHIKIRRDVVTQLWQKLCNNIPRKRGGRKPINSKVIRLTNHNNNLTSTPLK
ncbi:MAG: hypothetical protein H6Q73_1267 [Firmicutes bacterium]|nr:hypothetical protein [Bacillota bacterium]